MHGRIKSLADLFPRGNSLLDIGSDHGYLGIELLKSDKAMEVWNVDLSKKSLENSKKTYEKEGYLSRAKFICGNGFLKVTGLPANTVVVIAGMGSSQILKILEHMPDQIRTLILMSHTNYYPIRKWAWRNNWMIHEERYLEERGYHYMAMRLIKSNNKREEYTEEEYIFGKKMFRKEGGEMFEEFWREKSIRLLKIPDRHRNQLEKEIIRFLLRKNIITNIKPHEDS